MSGRYTPRVNSRPNGLVTVTAALPDRAMAALSTVAMIGWQALLLGGTFGLER